MTYRDGVLTGTVATALVAGLIGSIWWLTTRLGRDAAPKGAPAPAKVETILKEEQISTITLTADALKRLKLQTGVVEFKRVPQYRLLGGDVTVPPGRAIVVQAPMSGVVYAPAKNMVRAGGRVSAGQTVFQFFPLLTPESRAQLATSRVDADGQMKAAETQRDLARLARGRAQKVFESQAGSRRAVEEAQAQLDLAERSYDVAKTRRALLDQFFGEFARGTASAIPLAAPSSGLLRSVSVLPGQSVPAGAALFEILDPSRLWIKVAVYAGEANEIDGQSPVMIGRLSARPDTYRRAVAAIAPPSADPVSGTVDFYYELDNRDRRFRPGERVAVRMPMRGAAVRLTIPWSAVFYDIYGGGWVYEQTAERVFVRRRVEVAAVAGATAILSKGPLQGTPIVSAGAQELFGTETGFTK